jgi:hypothetical protein
MKIIQWLLFALAYWLIWQLTVMTKISVFVCMILTMLLTNVFNLWMDKYIDDGYRWW